MTLRLDINEDLPILVEYNYKNIYQRLGSRNIQAIAKWSNPIATYRIKKDIVDIFEAQIIKDIFNGLLGNLEPFVYIDPCDNTVTEEELISVNYGHSTQGLLIAIPELPGSYQACKIYKLGEQFAIRPLTKLIEGTITVGDELLTNVNHENGVVQTSGGQTIPFSGQFGVLCRLDTDILSTVNKTQEILEDIEQYESLSEITIKEVKENSYLLAVQENVGTDIVDNFAIPDFIERVNDFTHSTRIEEFDNGYELRRNNFEDRSVNYQLGEQNVCSQEEIDYLISLFRISKGGVTGITYNERPCHLKGSISIEADGELYKINSFPIIEKTNNNVIEILPEITNLTFGTYIINVVAGLTQDERAIVYEALDQYKTQLGNTIYAEQEGSINNYFRIIDGSFAVNLPEGYGGRWLSWFSYDPRNSTVNEPLKVAYVGWCKHSLGQYHGYGLADNVPEPTSDYIEDYNNFISVINNYEYFSAKIYHIKNLNNYSEEEYQYYFTHLERAYNGTDGYPEPMSNYGLQLRFQQTEQVDVQYYLNDFSAPNNGEVFTFPDGSGSTGGGTVPNESPPLLDRPFLFLCYCYKIIKNDGEVIGFTDHDKNIQIEDGIFYPNGGGKIESFENSYETNVNVTNNVHIFDSNAITIEDVNAGLYDNAKYEIILVNWINPIEKYNIFSGYLGKVSISYHKSEPVLLNTEIRSVTAKLKRKNTLVTNKLCPYKLGDNNCRVDITPYTDSISVTEVITDAKFKTNSGQTEDNYYATIKFTSGLNIGYEASLAYYGGSDRNIDLFKTTPYPITSGDTMDATMLCKKTLKDCHEKFNNAINHGGFPHIPGNDQIQKTR